MTLPLPRYVIAKRLASGRTGFYFNVPTHYRKLGCDIPNEPLGTDYATACGEDGNGGHAAALNGLFDEWVAKRKGEPVESIARFGRVNWLFREYKRSDAYLQKVSKRSRPDYERIMTLICDIVTKKGDRIGDRKIMSITPLAADKLYGIIKNGDVRNKVERRRPRQAEKAVNLCRKAWRVLKRLHPAHFDRGVPNPWEGVTQETRVKATKPAATREEAYTFAWGCIERGQPEAAAAAVICFEWLQRPENVLAGYLRWTDYRSAKFPTAIRIEHHKTGEMVWHPLEETAQGESGPEAVEFYPEAEAVLAKLPRRGLPLILYQPPAGKSGKLPPAKPFSFGGMQKIVQRMRAEIGLPATFTLDACRHGGMTELEEAQLTEGQGRALSAHRTKESYHGYAKRTFTRALGATRKRRAHVLANAVANAARTAIQNADAEPLQNGVPGVPRSKASFRRKCKPLASGWGARIRTWEWRNQNPLPYHLATPHQARGTIQTAAASINAGATRTAQLC